MLGDPVFFVEMYSSLACVLNFINPIIFLLRGRSFPGKNTMSTFCVNKFVFSIPHARDSKNSDFQVPAGCSLRTRMRFWGPRTITRRNCWFVSTICVENCKIRVFKLLDFFLWETWILMIKAWFWCNLSDKCIFRNVFIQKQLWIISGAPF